MKFTIEQRTYLSKLLVEHWVRFSVQFIARFERVALYVNLKAMSALLTVTCYSARSALHVCTFQGL
jgi:hypothetical protein